QEASRDEITGDADECRVYPPHSTHPRSLLTTLSIKQIERGFAGLPDDLLRFPMRAPPTFAQFAPGAGGISDVSGHARPLEILAGQPRGEPAAGRLDHEEGALPPLLSDL